MDPDTVQAASQVRRNNRYSTRNGTVVPVNNPDTGSVCLVGTGTAVPVYNMYCTGRYRTVYEHVCTSICMCVCILHVPVQYGTV